MLAIKRYLVSFEAMCSFVKRLPYPRNNVKGKKKQEKKKKDEAIKSSFADVL